MVSEDTGLDIVASTEAAQNQLRRSLSNRHIQLIAIGGAIGTGLFMGSGRSIHVAGPAIMVVYAIVGFMLYFVMRAMGELLLSNLDYKSFQDFAADIIGPWAGFVVGWTYWLCWVVLGMADIIAITDYWNFWTADWVANPVAAKQVAMLLAVGIMGLILLMNLLTVRLFGEMEFWFAAIKLVAIAALVVTAAIMIFTGFTHDGFTASISHIWSHGGIFPTGLTGFIGGFQLAIFAFVGIELVGTTAAETKEPTVTLPRAINSIPVRVLVFYIVALAAIMCITPWDQVDPEHSPFVGLFSMIGLTAAASIMNFVVLTSASSSCNSGVYSTSRMLYGLSHKGMAASRFGRISRHGVPWHGLALTVVLICLSLLLTASGSVMQAFTIITTVSSILFLVVWAMILISYIVYLRKFPVAHAASSYKMPGAHVMPWVVLAFFVFILVALTQDPDTALAEAVTPVWFVVLYVMWRRVRGRVRYDDVAVA
ncbi:MAG: amino acid permease [Ancrocorticia sp.]|jgi:D-serine/D-alanine/glycine transporter|nr:amino acid permease [Ancrocorticia sp.]MCI2194059.1 amino acid permease [Ancrocorticia sp.]MCI2199119.1 amino acid permease [Ancrocorticia sp.]